ncbi:hypothetical protein CEXT_550461 [Caerostris extrusa]|uniref:Uncharacterized protein n=1 Tax=Caerostris extrusa TaxID=172846 RepID=A0AAV4Q5B5_CAEEX|nr:hypothetical protein CEXT_550461 [Caerostris extrusa]
MTRKIEATRFFCRIICRHVTRFQFMQSALKNIPHDKKKKRKKGTKWKGKIESRKRETLGCNIFIFFLLRLGEIISDESRGKIAPKFYLVFTVISINCTPIFPYQHGFKKRMPSRNAPSEGLVPFGN